MGRSDGEWPRWMIWGAVLLVLVLAYAAVFGGLPGVNQ